MITLDSKAHSGSMSLRGGIARRSATLAAAESSCLRRLFRLRLLWPQRRRRLSVISMCPSPLFPTPEVEERHPGAAPAQAVVTLMSPAPGYSAGPRDEAVWTDSVAEGDRWRRQQLQRLPPSV